MSQAGRHVRTVRETSQTGIRNPRLRTRTHVDAHEPARMDRFDQTLFPFVARETRGDGVQVEARRSIAPHSTLVLYSKRTATPVAALVLRVGVRLQEPVTS
jgi:hypothetical protein